jgi:hypothetical protein
MNHLYKTVTTTFVPLVMALRYRIVETLEAKDWLLEIDVAIFLVLAGLAFVMWWFCLTQVRDMGLRIVFMALVIYATVLSTHILLVMISMMAESHPEWHEAVLSAVSRQLLGTFTPSPAPTEKMK